jgi:hypothetical protein
MSRRAVVASSEMMHSILTAADPTAAALGANDFAIWFLRHGQVLLLSGRNRSRSVELAIAGG